MNSDIIRLLPDSVANQIAAGEVIQRPASVIKELVENAIDAGATEITIVLKDAGRTLIQVVDNGCGMSPGDARMAFERHATSKISSAADLYTLHTMGFRGEALPSIAAVAQIELRTMRRGDNIGTRLQISESKFEGQEPCMCLPGTSLAVKNIFFHMPARRKFLKKDSVELNHIIREFERLALVNTGVDFTLIHNDVTLHQFLHSSFKQRIGALFGNTLESQLATLQTETSLVKIDGFIGQPRFAKRRGAPQFFFVNGRNMRHPYFHKALMNCYAQLIPSESQPAYFINFEVDPSTIDVNIHPQKHEIKFEHEQAIFQILEAAVRETLGKTQAVGGLDFDSDEVPEIPLFQPNDQEAMPSEGWDGGFDPFLMQSDGERNASRMPVEGDRTAFRMQGGGGKDASSGSRSASWQRPASDNVPTDWQKLYENFERKRDEAPRTVIGSGQSVGDGLPDGFFSSEAALDSASGSCFQLHGRYIVTPSRTGIMIINQHRAHINILYERYLKLMGEGPLNSQSLIFAEELQLSPNASVTLSANLEMVESLGFKVSLQGEGLWTLTAAPALMSDTAPVQALQMLVDALGDEEESQASSIRARAALAMARSSAIAAGRILSATEMDTLVADLFRCTTPMFTPDGLTVMHTIENDDIDKFFA